MQRSGSGWMRSQSVFDCCEKALMANPFPIGAQRIRDPIGVQEKGIAKGQLASVFEID
jgi:hypothetical protein